MLEQSHCLTFDKLIHHVTQHRPDCVEPLVSLADVCEAEIVEQNLLDDEDGHRFGELRAGLHNPETEGADLGREEEVDDVRVVILLPEARWRDQ